MRLVQSRNDRIVLAVALFGALALVALSTGVGAEFADVITGVITDGLEWAKGNKKTIDAVTSIVGGVVAVAGLFL
jgi:hypothetical protein